MWCALRWALASIPAICQGSFFTAKDAKDAKGLEIVAFFGAAIGGRSMSVRAAPKKAAISRPVLPPLGDEVWRQSQGTVEHVVRS